VKTPLIFRRKDVLSPAKAIYWKDLLYRTTKIGTELEVAPPKGMKRIDFEEEIRQLLLPSGNLARLGIHGVLDVQKEHCGVEIRIIGRHPYVSTLKQQYDEIISVLKIYGARARSTCGLHFHLLTPDLAEPMPEIILANLWNLTRRYAPELKYMTSAGSAREALCRRRNYNSHLEMVRHSPGLMHMAEIQQKLKASRQVPEHQNFFNLEHVGFTQSGAVWPFHIEYRFPDAELSPTAITAKTFLFLAMLLKAVDLSQYGVIHVGKITPWKRKIALLNMLSNNEGSLATSDTQHITDEVIEELKVGCYELLDLLMPVFDYLKAEAALDVLRYLANTPISLMRCAGHNWDEIESLLAGRADAGENGFDNTDRKLMQRIELGEWNGFSSVEEWQFMAARELWLTVDDLERRLEVLQQLRGLRWDKRLGTLVFMS